MDLKKQGMPLESAIYRAIYRDIMMLNKKMYVTISGKQVRILGKINTHNIIVDITDIDAKVGDEVLLNINPMLVGPHIEREYV